MGVIHQFTPKQGTKPLPSIIDARHTFRQMAYFMLKRQEGYRELGARYLDQLDRERTVKRLSKRLLELAYGNQSLGVFGFQYLRKILKGVCHSYFPGIPSVSCNPISVCARSI
jgi:hypothetical protein